MPNASAVMAERVKPGFFPQLAQPEAYFMPKQRQSASCAMIPHRLLVPLDTAVDTFRSDL
jgi:hypothetical protein